MFGVQPEFRQSQRERGKSGGRVRQFLAEAELDRGGESVEFLATLTQVDQQLRAFIKRGFETGSEAVGGRQALGRGIDELQVPAGERTEHALQLVRTDRATLPRGEGQAGEQGKRNPSEPRRALNRNVGEFCDRMNEHGVKQRGGSDDGQKHARKTRMEH